MWCYPRCFPILSWGKWDKCDAGGESGASKAVQVKISNPEFQGNGSSGESGESKTTRGSRYLGFGAKAGAAIRSLEVEWHQRAQCTWTYVRKLGRRRAVLNYMLLQIWQLGQISRGKSAATSNPEIQSHSLQAK